MSRFAASLFRVASSVTGGLASEPSNGEIASARSNSASATTAMVREVTALLTTSGLEAVKLTPILKLMEAIESGVLVLERKEDSCAGHTAMHVDSEGTKTHGSKVAASPVWTGSGVSLTEKQLHSLNNLEANFQDVVKSLKSLEEVIINRLPTPPANGSSFGPNGHHQPLLFQSETTSEDTKPVLPPLSPATAPSARSQDTMDSEVNAHPTAPPTESLPPIVPQALEQQRSALATLTPASDKTEEAGPSRASGSIPLYDRIRSGRPDSRSSFDSRLTPRDARDYRPCSRSPPRRNSLTSVIPSGAGPVRRTPPQYVPPIGTEARRIYDEETNRGDSRAGRPPPPPGFRSPPPAFRRSPPPLPPLKYNSMPSDRRVPLMNERRGPPPRTSLPGPYQTPYSDVHYPVPHHPLMNEDARRRDWEQGQRRYRGRSRSPVRR